MGYIVFIALELLWVIASVVASYLYYKEEKAKEANKSVDENGGNEA